MTSQVKILSANPDTLVLNCYPIDGNCQIERCDMPAMLRDELEQLKKLAQDREEPVPTRFEFYQASLKMQAKGGDGFNWILKNELITLAVNRSAKMQLWTQVRFSSLMLQTWRNLGQAIGEVHSFLKSIFGEYIVLQPSSLDLAVDLLFFDVGTVQDVKECFVTRAQCDDERPLQSKYEDDGFVDGPDSIKRRWRRITGLPFGARHAAISAIIYDKTHEIKYNSPDKAYMWDIWQYEAEKQGFCLLPTAKVMRLEIRLKRPALNEMKLDGVFHGIDDAYVLEGHLPGLWSYAVGHAVGGADGLPDGWLRYVIPSTDTNRSRWSVHPDWQVIQTAFQEERTDPDPVDFVAYARARKKDVNMRRLVAQIAGCVITSEAWRYAASADVEPDISDTFQFLYNAVESYLEENKRDFIKLVHKKRVVYDLERNITN